jgi:hypothetical protein
LPSPRPTSPCWRLGASRRWNVCCKSCRSPKSEIRLHLPWPACDC